MGVRSRIAVAAALLMLSAWSTTAYAKPHADEPKQTARASSVACPDDSTQPTLDTAGEAAFALLCDMNELRARNGVRPLRWDWRLWAAAQRHAGDMAARHYFAHQTPEGRGLVDRVQPTGYIPSNPNWLIGENIGFGTTYLSTPLAIALGWMDSPPHRENLLDPAFGDVGVGVAFGPVSEDGQSGIIYVANYGMRTDDPVRPRGRAGRSRKAEGQRVTRPSSRAQSIVRRKVSSSGV